MNTRITLSVEWSRSQVREVVFYLLCRRLGWLFALIALYPVVTVLVPLLYHAAHAGQPVAWVWDSELKSVVVSPVVAVVLFVAIWIRVSRQWTNNLVVREKKTFTFSEEGIALNSPSMDSTTAWSLVDKAQLRRGSLFLFIKGSGCNVIPRQALDNDAKRGELLELIRMHVANRNF